MLLPAASALDYDTEIWPDPIRGNKKTYSAILVLFLYVYGYFGFGFADDNVSCFAD